MSFNAPLKIILPTKITTAQNGVAHSYHRVRGLYFLAVIFAATIISNSKLQQSYLTCKVGDVSL